MKQMIPYEKLSKKEKRKRDLERRGSWGGINPVTRRPENPKAYRREKERSWKRSGSVRLSETLWDYLAANSAVSCAIISSSSVGMTQT